MHWIDEPGSVTVHPHESERTRKSCKERNNADATVNKRKDKYEDHPENQNLSAHGGDAFDSGPRRLGGGSTQATLHELYTTTAEQHPTPRPSPYLTPRRRSQ